ncbi:MAG: hypothetical protein NZ895_05330 [Archaeoglobaceae archaeon]|nr:hypothetical protein [Archaeoglobaceae archaeon]MCX8151519.1 hypothetical protein [Archaeoglobaceae archaeon]MDW8013245.1 hypothetical protein [Archaeoglobaceae archaeon]
MKCVECGKELEEKKEGIEWRLCTFCKKSVCFDDLHYIGIWRRGLYSNFVDVFPVCKNCLPKFKGTLR